MVNSTGRGHGGRGAFDVGAVGNGTTEYAEVSWINDQFVKKIGWADVSDYSATNVNQNLVNIVANTNRVSSASDITLSHHKNAFNGKATGVEVWYYLGDATGRSLAEKLSAAIANALGLQNRGAKGTTNLYVVSNTNAHCLLIEWCFVDNTNDMKKWNANKVKAVDAALKVLGFKGGNANMKPTYYKQKNCYYKITEKACTIYKEPEMKTKYYGTYARDSIIWVSDVKKIGATAYAGKTPGGWISLNSNYITDQM